MRAARSLHPAPLPLVRILVVDDHAVVRLGLRQAFDAVSDFSVAAEASGTLEALDAARRTRPDVVIMDVRLPDGSGAEACRAIRHELPGAQVIMLTSFPDEEALVAAVTAGASAYFLKGAEPPQLIDAVRRVAAGECLLDSASTRTVLGVLQRQAGAPRDPLSALSEPERRTLPLIAQGLTNRQIAQTLCLSDQTVKGYVSSILKKLGLSRRSQAAALAARSLPDEAPSAMVA